MSDDLQQRLVAGAAALELSLTPPQVDRLMAYLQALIKWNRAYNLTAIRAPQDMVDKHLLDSLSILPHLDASDFIDIGTGAGLPGMVVALMRPQLAVDLLDANGKKTRFLRQFAAEQQLANVRVLNTRCELHQGRYGQICSRAFASLQDMVAGTRHLLAENGRWLAMKGHVPTDELEALPPEIALEKTLPLRVPFQADARHLIVLSRRGTS